MINSLCTEATNIAHLCTEVIWPVNSRSAQKASNVENTIWLYVTTSIYELHIDGLEQDCSNSIANVLELLQSSTKPVIARGHQLLTHWLFRDVAVIFQTHFTNWYREYLSHNWPYVNATKPH